MPRRLSLALPLALAGLFLVGSRESGRAQKPVAPAEEYGASVRPLMAKYCLECHSAKVKKGSLDLERFATVELMRKELKPWLHVVEQLEAREMPPKGKPQPSDKEREQLLAWVKSFLDAEARARAGDPGHVPLRRLSNAEYNATVRDLTGVDLQPAREFPADGAGGEGFTNAAESLSDVSPVLLDKYLAAAKDISTHAVLLPDGFRFSPTRTRRDWTNECNDRIREFYKPVTTDGRLPLQPYLLATVRHRETLSKGGVEEVATKEKLNAKYLGILWAAMSDAMPSYPLDQIRDRWKKATEKDVDGLLAEIAGWQESLWKTVLIGSYRYGATHRLVANDPPTAETQTLRVGLKPAPGQMDVVIYLSAREVPAGKDGQAAWVRPRFESAGKPPLLLRDYASFGSQYEVDFASVFADTPKYLALAAEAGRDPKLSLEEAAKKGGLNPALAKRWSEMLALSKEAEPEFPGRPVPIDALTLLDEKNPKNDQKPMINGWHKKGTDLPVLLTNSSEQVENIPGRVPAHKVAVHPTPAEYVAAAWKSPIEGRVKIESRVAHAHPACGNGIAWWLEHRRGERAGVMGEGAINVGAPPQTASPTIKVAKGDLVILAVDARNRDHVCDLTEINFTVTEEAKPNRKWDLSEDINLTVLDGNPHADRQGNKDVWSFVRGPARPTGSTNAVTIPGGSLLAQWKEVALHAAKREKADELSKKVQSLLAGARPAQAGTPDRLLYDNLVSTSSPLLFGLDLASTRKKFTDFALPKDRFDRDGNLVAAANTVTEVRLPAALFHEHEFVVEGKSAGAAGDRALLFEAGLAKPQAARWDGKSPVVAAPGSAAHKQLVEGLNDFRNVFPTYICYPHIIPVDEVVCLKMFHREDEHFIRLFLNEEQANQLEHLWAEHRFVSQQPIAENKYLPLFIGFVTQDQPKELLNYFEGQRPVFQKRADDFEKELVAAIPRQLDALLAFAAKAYRRPVTGREKQQLLALYDGLRKRDVPHEQAFRDVLARVLVSPAFLFRIEQPPAGKDPGPVNDHELATRLSYFLWSSMPDDELRQLAAAGKLRDPKVLAEQAQRMLKDPKVRSLASEFGAQWLHVRGFEGLKEKNEKLFPTFNEELRQAIGEEAVQFFQDLFQSDRSVGMILDADYAILNETLAKHYGIPGVTGPQWRRVGGVRKYGRGGILALASVQSKESGASRTSPVLRGNWVVETLLGEKLPKPPPNVPQLPEEETGQELTVRQMTEKHTKQASCAECHVRIDPFGFAFEKYDPIGRFRDKDIAGRPIDTKVKLRDGAEFDGIDGLRGYLNEKKKDLIVRLFCQKLLGYALGRSTSLSDQVLIDEMTAELKKADGRITAAVLAIVRSPQFRMIRGSEFDPDS